MRSCVLVFILLALLEESSCANVLFVNGIPSPSHHHYNRVFVLGLATKGHNVTFLSVDLVKKEIKNDVHYIHLEKTYEFIFHGDEPVNLLDVAAQGTVESITAMPDFCLAVCHGALMSSGLDSLLNYPKDFKFDVLIYDFTFGPCLLPLLHKFNYPPLILVSAFANPPYTTDYVGGHKYPSYMGNYTAAETFKNITTLQLVFKF